jgi:predicted nucleic acid-binding protein
MTRAYVLDANAVLDLIEAGPGFRKVTELLEAALEQNTLMMISVLNLGEVFYTLLQGRGEEKARQMMASLSRLPVEFVPVDLEQSLQAGELKARHKLPYVDCIAAALAMSRQAVLVTSDRDFEKLGRRRIQILWLARP